MVSLTFSIFIALNCYGEKVLIILLPLTFCYEEMLPPKITLSELGLQKCAQGLASII